jgi:hypothetical protein
MQAEVVHGRVRSSWRPPARVWLRLAAAFQPGLAVRAPVAIHI